MVDTTARLLHALSRAAARETEVAALKAQLTKVEDSCTALTTAMEAVRPLTLSSTHPLTLSPSHLLTF